ncbi:MAG: hypothetical protein ABIT96_04855 [Ferruginibacter sp.]
MKTSLEWALLFHTGLLISVFTISYLLILPFSDWQELCNKIGPLLMDAISQALGLKWGFIIVQLFSGLYF